MNNNQTSSSVIADKYSINELCKQCLKWIEDEREQKKDAFVKELMHKGRFNLWGLIKRKPYTYEEAKAELESEGWESDYFWIDLKYGDDEKEFHCLMDAIQISSPEVTTITLSTKDAQLLEVYRKDL